VLQTFQQWTVILGAHNLRDSDEPGRVKLVSRAAIPHEEFVFRTLNNDLGVIQLPEEVQFSGMSWCASPFC